MISLKEKAEIYSIGLIIGLFSIDDVTKWIDFAIENESNIDYSLIEVSLNSKKNPEDIVHNLKNIEGNANPKIVVNAIIGLLSKMFDEDNSSGAEIARMLHRLIQNIDAGVMDNQSVSKINSIDDGFYLAEQNIYGYVKDMLLELKDFLKDYKKYVDLLIIE